VTASFLPSLPDQSAATMTNADQGYAFGNSVTGQRDRLRALEAVFDGGTFRRLAECGVGPGWRCLEVGAGAGSVATWLADRVGLDGSVLATDLDTTLLDDLVRPPLTVRRHNVMTDPLPEASFDLVHARLLLAWLPDPAGALRRLVTALKPGGWLVVKTSTSHQPFPTLTWTRRRPRWSRGSSTLTRPSSRSAAALTRRSGGGSVACWRKLRFWTSIRKVGRRYGAAGNRVGSCGG
jgi:SAM-dependent methyltransferase